MQNRNRPTKDSRNFRSFLSAHRAITRAMTNDTGDVKILRTAKPNEIDRMLKHEEEIGDSYEMADFERQKLSDGTSTNPSLAFKWCSLFRHPDAFAGAPLPRTALQPSAPEEVRRHILIADDDLLVRGSLAAVLEFEGFIVDEAGDGMEAVERAIAHPPDLVLLDINMPKMDGWSAFIKLDRVRPLMPVIIITARPHQYKEAVQLGVDAFMEKPLNISLLVNAIKRLSEEDENHHVHRVTDPEFVTQLLDNAEP